MPGTKDDEPVDFELSEEELKAIAEAGSEVLPDEPSSAETPYTIRNAPVAKSIVPAHEFDRRPGRPGDALPVANDEDDDDTLED